MLINLEKNGQKLKVLRRNRSRSDDRDEPRPPHEMKIVQYHRVDVEAAPITLGASAGGPIGPRRRPPSHLPNTDKSWTSSAAIAAVCSRVTHLLFTLAHDGAVIPGSFALRCPFGMPPSFVYILMSCLRSARNVRWRGSRERSLCFTGLFRVYTPVAGRRERRISPTYKSRTKYKVWRKTRTSVYLHEFASERVKSFRGSPLPRGVLGVDSGPHVVAGISRAIDSRRLGDGRAYQLLLYLIIVKFDRVCRISFEIRWSRKKRVIWEKNIRSRSMPEYSASQQQIQRPCDWDKNRFQDSMEQ
ncbi:hypothetical protein EVAR_2239_1 [Eumeta japonica]|uniref:Uncharacterized protein n=1 Tax=Eumeta variegata TaxID=151549 RepID=A0A4C1SHR2_EUMVA|nr:hypothetical protein EVAR_2239_1 [Eumeta japonica]